MAQRPGLAATPGTLELAATGQVQTAEVDPTDAGGPASLVASTDLWSGAGGVAVDGCLVQTL